MDEQHVMAEKQNRLFQFKRPMQNSIIKKCAIVTQHVPIKKFNGEIGMVQVFAQLIFFLFTIWQLAPMSAFVQVNHENSAFCLRCIVQNVVELAMLDVQRTAPRAITHHEVDNGGGDYCRK